MLTRGNVMKLKRCPFCGNCGEIIRDKVDDFPFVPRCENPECIGHYIFFLGFRTVEEAANTWNRRYAECSNIKPK